MCNFTDSLTLLTLRPEVKNSEKLPQNEIYEKSMLTTLVIVY